METDSGETDSGEHNKDEGIASLADIRDVEAFSGAVVRRSLAKGMLPDEVEEAIAEGVVLLYELHERWDPAKTPSFYRWATTNLYLRLIDWWRREMRQRNLAHRRQNGDYELAGGGYIYHGRISLDERLGHLKRVIDEELGEDRDDRALVTADHHRIGE